MCALAVTSRIFEALVIGAAAAISAAFLSMPARAAEKPVELPRYRLKPG